MSTITRERIAQYANDMRMCNVNDEIRQIARIALSSLEAEPVAYIRNGFRADGVHFCGGIITAEEHERTKPALSDRYNWKHQPLYTAPPAPVSVPDDSAITQHFDTIALEVAREIMCDVNRRHEFLGGEVQLLSRIQCRIDDACRAAMLQGAETVTTAYKLRDAVETIRNSGIEIDAEKIFAERDALNAPDCWCRTCRPITLTDMRFVVCPDCGNKRCPHANDHRNACTGSNEPGQEGSAYPAAPQQE